jgi:hypothetical protein
MRSLIGAGKPRYADVLAQRALFIYLAIVKRHRSLRAFVTSHPNHFNQNFWNDNRDRRVMTPTLPAESMS